MYECMYVHYVCMCYIYALLICFILMMDFTIKQFDNMYVSMIATMYVASKHVPFVMLPLCWLTGCRVTYEASRQ